MNYANAIILCVKINKEYRINFFFFDLKITRENIEKFLFSFFLIRDLYFNKRSSPKLCYE